MTRDDPGIEWIVISDFSAGIVHNLAWNALGGMVSGYGPGAQGAASMDGTFRCIALPNGGLGPLPRRDFTVSRPAPASGKGVTQMCVQFILHGTMARLDSVVGAGSFNYPIDNRDMTKHFVEFFCCFQGFGSSTAREVRWTKDQLYMAANPATLTASEVTTIDTYSGSSSSTHRDTTHYSPTYYDLGRFNSTAPTSVGKVGTIWSWVEPWKGDNPNFGQSTTKIFPDPTGVARAYEFSNVNFLGALISHQNRVVCIENYMERELDSSFSTARDELRTFARLVWTNPNDITLSNGAADQAFGGADIDNHAGYGAWGSLSSSDLLLIRHGGGAIVLQGNLDTPVVRRMPGVTGTYGTQCGGASTSVGFVYGVNRGGVFSWAGGNSSQDLSPQLPPDFWIHPDTANLLDWKGSFHQWFEWIAAPNSFLYDPQMKSWWRLEDPTVANPYMYQVNPGNGYLYGLLPLVASSDGGGIPNYIHGWNPSVGANSYSWHSQPLFGTQNRVNRVREIVLIAQGTGTIVVTMDNMDGTTQSETLTLAGSSTIPQLLRSVTVARNTGNCRLKLVATGASTDPAPVIYELRVAWEEGQKAVHG